MKKESDKTRFANKQKLSASDLMGFWDYLEFYPEADDPEYDGIHAGGIKGIAVNAPDTAKAAFKKYQQMVEEAKKRGIKY